MEKDIKKTESEKFNELLYWKNEFRKVLKEQESEDSILSKEELRKRFLLVEKKMSEAEYQMIDVSKGMYLGIGYPLNRETGSKGMPIYAKWKNLNNHLGFKGTTRVGKTQNMLWHIEQCIANNFDVIIVDPKGGERQEVLSSVAESCYKYERSEELTYYSPAFEELSQKMNTLYGKSNMEIASMIVDSIAEPGMESFYLEIATRCLLAITSAYEYLQAVSDPDGTITRYIEEEELRKYYEFANSSSTFETYGLKHGDVIEKFHLDINFKTELKELTDIGFNRTLITFRDLERFCSYDGLQKLLKLVQAIPLNKNLNYSENKMLKLKAEAVRVLSSALRTDVAHFSKVADTLANRLLQLSIGPIGEMLCGTRINPLANRLRREDKGVVAVIQPYPMKFKKSADMFNKIFLGSLDAMMGTVAAEGRPLPRRIALFIDEAGIIVFPGIQNFFNRAGGLGISCFVYTQTDEDYKLALTDSIADVIMSNVNTVGIMRQPLFKSAQEAAESIGTVYVHKTVAMVTAGGGDGRYSSDIKEEFLCTPRDIKQLPVGEGILTHDGKDYYMEFPYRIAPRGAFRMPSLDSEKAQRHLIAFEEHLETIKAKELLLSESLVSNHNENVIEAEIVS